MDTPRPRRLRTKQNPAEAEAKAGFPVKRPILGDQRQTRVDGLPPEQEPEQQSVPSEQLSPA